MISVVIPLYNKEKQIQKTMNTILSQSYQNFEIVIVNDGSTDSSVQQVQAIKDKRIHLFHQKNAGVSAARNTGIREAKGEFIAFLDADDEWKSDYLQKLIELTDRYPQADIFGSNYCFKNPQGKITPTILRRIQSKEESFILNNYFEIASYSHPPLCSSAIMVRRSAINSIGGFPLGIKSGEDLLTWARLAVRYKIAYSIEPNAIFNVEGYNLKDKPKRVPAKIDLVGHELTKLYKETKFKGLRKYISHWHKMRASVYMRLNLRKESLAETCKALYYNPFNYKLYAYIILNFIPSRLRPF